MIHSIPIQCINISFTGRNWENGQRDAIILLLRLAQLIRSKSLQRVS